MGDPGQKQGFQARVTARSRLQAINLAKIRGRQYQVLTRGGGTGTLIRGWCAWNSLPGVFCFRKSHTTAQQLASWVFTQEE